MALTLLLSELAIFSKLGREIEVEFLLVGIVATRAVVAGVTGGTSIVDLRAKRTETARLAPGVLAPHNKTHNSRPVGLLFASLLVSQILQDLQYDSMSCDIAFSFLTPFLSFLVSC